MYKYPVYQPSITGNEKKYVDECLDTTWISSKGRFISEFENQFADYIGVKHAATVCNGTVAIHLALVALGVGPGDEVIVPTFTYIASVNPILQMGATPVFVDSNKDTWQLDPADVAAKITPKTKAIIAVHLYGQPCDMDLLKVLAKAHNLFIIEDCAEAIGSEYKGKKVGSFGDIACFSFFGNKTITCGEGGMVTTNDSTLYDRLVHFKGQGLAKYREYWHDTVGFNYRMTNIAAAIGLAQLEQVQKFIDKKRQIADWYREGLKGLPVQLQPEAPHTLNTYWMCTILTDKEEDRDTLRAHLKNEGIETRPTFYPVHTMPMYAMRFQQHPVAEDIASRGINLPSYPQLTKEDINFICEKIRGYYEE